MRAPVVATCVALLGACAASRAPGVAHPPPPPAATTASSAPPVAASVSASPAPTPPEVPTGAADLVALLEHKDERLRRLAAQKLSAADLDDALAKRALAAIAAERSASLATVMGQLAAAIAHARGVGPEIQSIAHTHPLLELRKAVLSGVVEDACCPSQKLTLGAACRAWIYDRDEAVRRSSSETARTCISIALTAPPAPSDCGDLVALADVDDGELASEAMRRAVEQCPSQRAKILAIAPSRSSSKWVGSALIAFCAIPATTTAPERRLAANVAVRIAKNRSLDVEARSLAVTALSVCTVNFGSDGYPYAKMWSDLEKQVEPEVWSAQRRTGIP